VLRSATGSPQTTLSRPDEFATALRKAMTDAKDIELLFAIWEQNVETVRALNRCHRASRHHRMRPTVRRGDRPIDNPSRERTRTGICKHSMDT
jgi:hypothetical protein